MHFLQNNRFKLFLNFTIIVQASIGTISYRDFQPHVQNILLSFGDWEKPMKHHFRLELLSVIDKDNISVQFILSNAKLHLF